MLRTYVRAATGSLIDFDRALLLMDGELIDAVIAAQRREPDTSFSCSFDGSRR